MLIPKYTETIVQKKNLLEIFELISFFFYFFIPPKELIRNHLLYDEPIVGQLYANLMS